MKGKQMVGVLHTSVLKEEVFRHLKPDSDNGFMIDATLGEGGHAEYFLSREPDLTIAGIDADSSILAVAMERLEPFGTRMQYFHQWFNGFFASYPADLPRPDRILFDLGISSYHYAKSNRGFSFRTDEVLDMRLDSDLEITAADIVNEYPESELADLLYGYGEERYSRQIAKAVVRARKQDAIRTSSELAGIISDSVPPQYKHGRIHPATRSFQALRIAVNGELVRLEQALKNALSVLKVGGRMGVISFHSLEDRIVKRFFVEKNKSCTCPPEWPMCNCGGKKIVDIVTRKPIEPDEREIAENKPSRSARFRVAEKINEESI
jgi:16S rRNA (cytosine1402-N4)-methyltransferase